MPVLAMFLASFLVFILILCLLAVAKRAEDRHRRRTTVHLSGKPFSALSVSDAFDPSHAILWETQVPALQLIHAAGPSGLPAERLYPFYRCSAHLYPELYDGTSFAQWLEFLEVAQLVRPAALGVAITPEGLEFMKYRVTTDALVTR